MKRIIYTGIIFASIVVAFVVGMVVGKGNYNKEDVVGVYMTDSWNGKSGTLVLYADGTCQYPSGGNATWKVDDGIVRITHESNYTIQDGGTKGLKIFIDNNFSDEKIKETLNSIERLNNVESVNWAEETNLCNITLAVAEIDKKTSNELSKLEGISIIELILDNGVNTSEHEAKIMESGIVLHDHFFEKVSN